jgi:hypothetical protein
MRHFRSGAVCLVCLAGCLTLPGRGPDAMPFHENPEAMRHEVLRHVPFGMPIKQARTVMEASGFHCHKYAKARIMLCDTEQTIKNQPTRIRVWLYFDPEELVKEVLVRCDVNPDHDEPAP